MAIQLIDTVTPDIGLKTVADKLNNNFTDPSHAASRLVTSSSTDTTSGRLLRVGDFGIGVDEHNRYSDFNSIPKVTGVYQTTSGPENAPDNTGTTWVVIVTSISSVRAAMLAFGAGDSTTNYTRNNSIYRRWMGDGAWSSPWQEIYHTGNTIVDTNGFIKQV